MIIDCMQSYEVDFNIERRTYSIFHREKSYEVPEMFNTLEKIKYILQNNFENTEKHPRALLVKIAQYLTSAINQKTSTLEQEIEDIL